MIAVIGICYKNYYTQCSNGRIRRNADICPFFFFLFLCWRQHSDLFWKWTGCYGPGAVNNRTVIGWTSFNLFSVEIKLVWRPGVFFLSWYSKCYWHFPTPVWLQPPICGCFWQTDSCVTGDTIICNSEPLLRGIFRILCHCRMQAFWHSQFDIFSFWHLRILHIMMHFSKDKHWLEWNLSCVAIFCPAVVAGRQTAVLFLPLPVNVFRGDYRCDPDKRANSLVPSDWLSVVGQRIDLEVVISMDRDNHIVTFTNTLRWKESKTPFGIIWGHWKEVFPLCFLQKCPPWPSCCQMNTIKYKSQAEATFRDAVISSWSVSVMLGPFNCLSIQEADIHIQLCSRLHLFKYTPVQLEHSQVCMFPVDETELCPRKHQLPF